MGSGTSSQNPEPLLQRVRVLRTRPKYPHPSPPKWFLSDIRPLIRAPDVGGPETRGLDWDTLQRTINADQENPSYDSDVISKTRPSSGIGMSRTDSGLSTSHIVTKSKTDHRRRVLSFNMIDKHAQTASSQHSATFTELVDFLKQPISPDLYPETCLVRALTIWLSIQNRDKVKHTKRSADVTTPDGIIQHLRQQTMTLTEAFTLLCRGVGIPTVIINGFVKAGHYQPGDIIDDTARGTWCAVHVDGSWQLVHTQWVCRGTYGPVKVGWAQIEPDEYLASKEIKKMKEDKNALIINEEFFMPRPDVFIYRCYAENTQWHLIPQGKTLRSIEEFAMLSYISPTFFKYGLSLASSPFSVQKTKNGIVQIEIIAPKEYVHALNFGYQIRSEESNTGNSSNLKHLLQKDILSRFIINYRSNDRFVYEIRLPVKGTYHFVVTGGFGSAMCNLCRFRLECSENAREVLIPHVHPGAHGWGPGPLAEQAGLLLPTKPSGLITIHSPNPSAGVTKNASVFHHLVTLNFQLNKVLVRKFDYSVEVIPSVYIDTSKLESHFLNNGELKVNPMQNINKAQQTDSVQNMPTVRAQSTMDYANRQYTTNVIGNLKGEESVILIKATEMELKNNTRVPIKGSTKVVCYYIISDSTYIAREPTQVKLAKQSLQEAIHTNDIGKIDSALSKCLRMNVPKTDDIVAAAESRLEYLKLRRDILDCIKRRNVAVVNETICRVASYRYREALVLEMEKLLDFKAELQGLEGYTRQLPNIREAIEELHMLTSPSASVHNTVKCLCLLVGFDENLKDWKYLRSSLKVTGDYLNEMVILKRMELMSDSSFPWRNMDTTVLDRVNNGLHEFPYEQVKHVSQAAATIYKWIDTMLVHAKQALHIPT